MAIELIIKRNNRRKNRDNFRYFSQLSILDKKRKHRGKSNRLTRNIGLFIFICILILMCLKFSNFL